MTAARRPKSPCAARRFTPWPARRSTDGIVVIQDGKITAIGRGRSDRRARRVSSVLEAAVVTPGLIDAHSTVGFSGILNKPHDQDQLERSAPIQPELRAIDAYNARKIR